MHNFKRVAVSTAALAFLGASSMASAVGVDRLESTLYPNYVTQDMLTNADVDSQNWLHYGKDYQMTRYSQLSQVNRENVKSLKPAWNMSFGILEGQDSQAVAVNGTLYVTTSFNRVIAVNGATGDIIWKYERELPGDVFPKLCCDVVNRGVAVYKNRVYLATLDAHIVALDNQTGDVVWDKKLGDYTYAETFTIMPLAVNNKIVFGTAGAEYGVRGWLAAIDADTGAPAWKTYTIPGPGEPGNDTWGGESWKYGGGSTWITGSYDKETNQLYWPVGNPGPDFDRHVRPGDNLFSNSAIVVNADTGKMDKYFQYTPNDPYDYDGVNENVQIDLGGKKLFVHGDRNGYIYGIDRRNTRKTASGNEMKCLWATAMQDVNWVKEPISPAKNNCRPVFNYPEMDVVYDRVTMNIAPSLDGGKEWHPLSVSLRTKMAYVPIYNFTMDLQAKKMEWKRGEWYLGAKVITFNAGAGLIKAFDVATGKLAWTRSQSWPATSGLLSTAGGLAFYGDPDGRFNAVNDETGEHLWSFHVGSGIHGNPTTYTLEGTQYVAIVYGAGGGGIWPLYYANFLKTHTKGGGLMVFSVN
ncbi:MAG: PQQ-dependent dehydrogenase, methanol/ethanol family [Proteobacteria bacterium]|nr:PQQ-dependent dehydrogenase, methanol/ethanol family [Pseudomonadota bacterium]MDA1331215.1 PQQ-dependent dehydrogenase, methanol/ethanol family [Pseudomonadota bacterium]